MRAVIKKIVTSQVKHLQKTLECKNAESFIKIAQKCEVTHYHLILATIFSFFVFKQFRCFCS